MVQPGELTLINLPTLKALPNISVEFCKVCEQASLRDNYLPCLHLSVRLLSDLLSRDVHNEIRFAE